MKKRAIVAKDPSDFPEVLEFLDAQAALSEFKDHHAAVFEELSELVERYNTALENAGQKVRQQEVKCGPFDAYQVSVTYDPDALYKALGHDEFLQVGGAIGTQTTYTVDKGRLEAAIAAPNSKIPKGLVPTIRKESVKYHMPEKAALP